MAKKDYVNWDKNDLIKEIEQLRKRKKYGLVWEDKPEDVAEQCKNELPVLEEETNHEIKLDDDKSVNLLIEGDNFHALSVLNYTHNGKIDFIYIDPPYNTGNKTWKYNNNYVDDEDPYRHSKWISFIYKRIKLAKPLLRKRGVLCVTIDNYELHNIRHILEEVFPDKEVITTVIEHNYRGRAKNNFALTHEYALWVVNKGEDIITKKFEVSDDIRRNLRRTGQGSRRHESPTLFYGIEVNKKTLEIISATKPIPPGEILPQSTNQDTEMVYPIDGNGIERRWYYGSKTMLNEAKIGSVYAKLIKDKIEVHYWKPGKPARRKSVWTGPKYDSSTYGSELLTEIIGENDFPYPKSLYAVYDSIEAGTANKNAIVLDFFAGSGTTAHAILEMNKKDGGNRKFIMCTNNENGICDEIIYPRINNLIKGYKFTGKVKDEIIQYKLTLNSLKGIDEILEKIQKIEDENKKTKTYKKIIKKIDENTLYVYGERYINGSKEGYGGNLKYYRTAFVPAEPTDKNKVSLTKKATEMLCVKEDTFEKVKSNEKYKIFRNKKRYTGIIFDHRSINDFKNEIKSLDGIFSVYIFSLGDDTFNEEFEDLKNKVKLSPIPEAILRVYRRIFK